MMCYISLATKVQVHVSVLVHIVVAYCCVNFPIISIIIIIDKIQCILSYPNLADYSNPHLS